PRRSSRKRCSSPRRCGPAGRARTGRIAWVEGARSPRGRGPTDTRGIRGLRLVPWWGRVPHGGTMTLARCSPPLLPGLAPAPPAAAGDLPAERGTAALPGLEKYVDGLRERTGVPGIAVAVVHADRVVYLKGFGVREIGAPGPIDADTVFQLASVSKPLTATVIAGLVGDGTVTWAAGISALDPGFRLWGDSVSAAVTLRDLLCHRTGLPEHAGDLLEDLGYSRAEILRRLRYQEPAGPFRASHAYTNFAFTEAAVAAAR